MKGHVVFKFLNNVTDKRIRVVLATLVLMLRCVQTNVTYMCVYEGENESGRERETYVLSVHNKT